jgi:iron complex outermembrane recepter protein
MIRSILTIVIFVMVIKPATAQQSVVEGVITDSKGATIVGATVIVKGTNTYALTGDDGAFKLNAPKQLPFSIRISSTGFKPQDIQVFEIPDEPLEVSLQDENVLTEIVVTARRRSETVQAVPIPISVVGGELIEDAGAFNVNRVKELVPTVQLYSSNPRNTSLNIRGLGSTFGLTNDGIDPGVGFYVDGVYYARPAATTLDFVDIEQIEVLRGPQGTLFGKNTTAGAFNVTTRAASFTPGASFEVSYGNYGFIQAKSSVTGPLSKKFAARLSFSGTQRDGVLYNVSTGKSVNDLNNLGFRAQLLYTPTDRTKITFIGDATRQRPEGYAQVIAGVVQTQRAGYRQFEQIIADLNYDLPSRNPFDRKIDHNTTWRSGNELGGLSVNVDTKIGPGALTSTTAWRFWNWDPSNDRDFTGLSVLQLSQATSKHQQWTQELRYAGEISNKVSGVIGAFFIDQDLKTDPFHVEESGAAQWRFSQSTTSNLWQTPGLFDGYGIRTTSRLETFGAAAFGQIDWAVSDQIHVLPGIRYNYDKKKVDFNRETYGGLDTSDPALIALKRLVYTDQAFTADVKESNFSGQVTVSYRPLKNVNTFATYSTSYKPVGVNLGGLPTAQGEILLDLARIKPEYVNHYEVAVKTNPTSRTTLNLAVFNTDIDDFQTQVQTAEVGVNRGYLANAEKVQVRGAELDGNIRFSKNLSLYGALAYTDGRYVSFTNAPVPLEETGAPDAFKDISGGGLPGISKWAGSLGGEILSNALKLVGQESKLFFGADTYFRSSFSSSASPSQFLNVDGYALVNARFGFRSTSGLSAFIWARNLLDKDYFEQLLPAAGNAGHYAAVLGDPQTYGLTLRYSY